VILNSDEEEEATKEEEVNKEEEVKHEPVGDGSPLRS
jgi:hypothetical protein